MIEDNGDHGNPASAAYRPERPDGAQLIADERERQVTEKGYAPATDDQQTGAELTACAKLIVNDYLAEHAPHESAIWPLQRAGHVRNKYHSNPIRQLTIAGALIAAEIDRLIRKETTDEVHHDPAIQPEG